MKTMTEKAMNAAAAKLGVKIVVLQCSGYVRLQALQNGLVLASVETTDCTLAQARARIIAYAAEVAQ